ncbi:MAG TPA: hypothetical protein EYP65_08990, partial [Armatimonadetes bacterium]|nr:hypothetical protein [Armatimonadota bacterium]
MRAMLIVKAVLVGLSVPLLALAAALALGRRDFALGAASGGAIGVVSFLLLMAMVLVGLSVPLLALAAALALGRRDF